MSYVPKVEISMPSRSNAPLSYINRFDSPCGVLIPSYIQDIQKSDDWHMSMSSLYKTFPLEGPLMGSFHVKLDFYFCPERFYNRRLHDNNTRFDPFTTYYPTFSCFKYRAGDIPAYYQSNGVHPSSLMHFLGAAEEFCADSEDVNTEVVERAFNAVPMLAYWDIFKSYYANTQEEAAYMIGVVPSSVDPNPSTRIVGFRLDQLDDVREWILQQPPNTVINLNSFPRASIPESPFYEPHQHCALGGLALRTHLSDRNTVFVKLERYNQIDSQTMVDASSGAISIDNLRFQSALNKMLQRTLVAGRKYSDWLTVQYGGSNIGAIECPEFIGSFSDEITFDDVVQTSTSTDGNSDPLGTLGARGRGGSFERRLRYYAKEHGFILGIFSIIPRVSYYEGVRHWHRWSTIGDRHVPAMDGIGFEDFLADNFAAFTTDTEDVGSPNAPVYSTFAKQPAWIDYMTRVDEVHGSFARPDELMYLTLTRRYSDSNLPNFNFERGAFGAYIDPGAYNYAFADASLTASNFWCQHRYKVVIKRAISKRVMPHL